MPRVKIPRRFWINPHRVNAVFYSKKLKKYRWVWFDHRNPSKFGCAIVSSKDLNSAEIEGDCEYMMHKLKLGSKATHPSNACPHLKTLWNIWRTKGLGSRDQELA